MNAQASTTDSNLTASQRYFRVSNLVLYIQRLVAWTAQRAQKVSN